MLLHPGSPIEVYVNAEKVPGGEMNYREEKVGLKKFKTTKPGARHDEECLWKPDASWTSGWNQAPSGVLLIIHRARVTNDLKGQRGRETGAPGWGGQGKEQGEDLNYEKLSQAIRPGMVGPPLPTALSACSLPSTKKLGRMLMCACTIQKRQLTMTNLI